MDFKVQEITEKKETILVKVIAENEAGEKLAVAVIEYKKEGFKEPLRFDNFVSIDFFED